MKDIVLEIKNLSKKYGKRKIIDNLSLNVEAGQVYGFLGANGAGKTTTMKMIVGFIDIDCGEIYINGINTKKEHARAMENVGAVIENPDLYDYLSGLDNLKLYARIHNIDKKRVFEVIKIIGLEARINDKVKKYSLGMKQRLGIGVAILHRPKLLILDEPTNGLDPEGIKELRDFLKDMAHKDNIAIFVSSHLLSEMQLMCDKIAIIDKGKIVKVDDVSNIKSNKKNIYDITVNDLELGFEILSKFTKCEIKDSSIIVQYDKSVSDLLKVLIEKDIEIISCNKKENTLEEEYLNIIKGAK